MSTDTQRKRTIRNRAAATGENYTEAATRLSMLAKVPSLPAPIVHADGERDTHLWGELSLGELIAQDWGLSGSSGYGQSAEEIQRDNTRRAGYALSAVFAYAQHVGTDEDSIISDLLCDLRHLCDALGEDFDNESRRGGNNHAAEQRGEF